MVRTIFSSFFASFIFIFNLYAFDNVIGVDNLSSLNYNGSPRDHFALNGSMIRLKTPGTLLNAVWAGHKITPSENSISFKAKSINGKNVFFNLKISMHTQHGDQSEKCNGKAETKYFNFSGYAQNKLQEFRFLIAINSADLACQQCGKITDHAVFLFHFGTEKEGGIEFTPFTLKTAFYIRLQKKSDEHDHYLSNILSPDYKPYEMKKLPDRSMLAGNFKELSAKTNITREQYSQFLAVLELLQKNDNKNAIIQAEKIAEKNIFSSAMLYLVYSRGYCGEKTDYSKAAKYFNRLMGSYYGREPGYMFWLYEYMNIWKKYRLMPDTPGEKVTINAWSNSGSVMEEIVPLRGKYPLKNCYEECMRNIGGVGARALYLISREQYALTDIMADARKFGNAEAWAGDHAPFESRGMMPQRTPLAKEGFNKPDEKVYQNMKYAADLGYIPAKLYIARNLATKNFTPQGFDLPTARKLLKEAIAECEKYSAYGCKHAETDLKYARDLLAVIPEENTPVQELIKAYDQLQMETAKGVNLSFLQFRMNILAELISKKDGHPDTLFLQALKLPNSQYKKKNNMIRDAAEKGSVKAIKMCLDQLFNRSNKDYWYFLYLAGKYKLPYNGYRQNYFNEAFRFLREMRYQMPPPEYMKAISVLAPYHKFAKEEFSKLSRELNFDISISDKTTLSAVKINNGGRHYIEIKAQPSAEKRYIIIRNKSAEKIRGAVFFYSLSKQCSNLDVSGEFTDENGRLRKTYPGDSIPMKFLPAELKISLAPRTEVLDMQIQFQLF